MSEQLSVISYFLRVNISAHSLAPHPLKITKNHIFYKKYGKNCGILLWPALYAAEQTVHPAFLTHQFL